MPRVAIPVVSLSGPRASQVGVPGTIYTAADATEDHEFTHPGGVVELYVQNGSGLSMSVVVKAVASTATQQMAEDKTETVAIGAEARIRIGYGDGYVTATGTVEIDIDQDTSSYLGVYKVT